MWKEQWDHKDEGEFFEEKKKQEDKNDLLFFDS